MLPIYLDIVDEAKRAINKNIWYIINDIYEISLVKDHGMVEWKIYSLGGHLDSYIIEK